MQFQSCLLFIISLLLKHFLTALGQWSVWWLMHGCVFTTFYFSIVNQCDRCLVPLAWGLMTRGCGVVRAIASHQCGPGSNPGVDTICGLSVLLLLFLALRGFSPGSPLSPSPQKPTLPNSNSIWKAWTRFNRFLRAPKNAPWVNKLQITIITMTRNCQEELALPKVEAHGQLGCPSQPSTVLNEC